MQLHRRKIDMARGIGGARVSAGPFTGGDVTSDAELVRASGFFRESWYLQTYPEAEKSGLDPLEHFLRYGASGAFDPGPRFPSARYIEAHPELRETGENPLTHYLRVGIPQDRSVDPDAFDSDLSARQRARDAGEMFARRFGLQTETAASEGLIQAAEYLSSLRPVLLGHTGNPEVSIVILAQGGTASLLSLLDSLAWHETQLHCEIVVVDDASIPEEETDILQRISWLRLERNATALGMSQVLERVVAATRGKHVVFLGGANRVATRWLDELIGSFSLFPRAGIVGPRLLRSDLRLQQAGSIVLKGGAVRRYGFDKPPDHPRYTYARQTDSVPAVSLAIRREVWDELGGFDEAFMAGAHGETDLAFRAREAGHEVWYQPTSQVIALDDVGGVAESEERKKTSGPLFRERWRRALRKHGGRSSAAYEEANRYAGKPFVVFDQRTPAPDRDAGSYLAVSLIRSYMELGWHVLFAPVPNFRPRGKYTRDLQRIGVECLSRPHFDAVADIAAHVKHVDYILAFRVNVLDPIIEDLRRFWPAARIIYDTVDLHHLREARQAEVMNDDGLRRLAAETRERELRLVEEADCTVVLAESERDHLHRAAPGVSDNLLVFPYVMETAEAGRGLTPERRDVVFLGGFMHRPNIDAATLLKERLWPQLRERLPADVKLRLVGADAGPDILSLADDRIDVTGFIPDLTPVFEGARVFVAPLRYGAGIKGKLIHALAHGVPSVASSIAADGMGLVDGRDLFIADGEQAFCDAVLRLYEDDALWMELHRNGRAFVERNYSRKSGLEKCQTMLDIADRAWARRHESDPRDLQPL